MKWVIKDTITDEVRADLCDFDDVLSQLLFARGIYDKATAQDFFDNSTLEYNDPRLLSDIHKACERIRQAKDRNEQVYIYGDYDVDGVMATTIIWDFLYRQLGIDVKPYIPSRFDEGYGLGHKGLSHIKEQGASLVISVDCGIRDIELVEEYSKSGLDFIITDHHSLVFDANGELVYPDRAIAVVHPRHPGSKYPFVDICGAAVAWKLVKAYAMIYPDDIDEDFDPEEYVDMAAIATVTDIMPLISENRLMVSRALARLKKPKNLGLRTLMMDADIQFDQIDAYHFGFVIGPRINAAGRMEDALDAVRLMSTESEKSAKYYSQKLQILNTKRQRITQEIFQLAVEMIESEDQSSKLHLIWGEGWPEGIVGLVAGKLQEKYHKPILVASLHDGKAVGSARSIPSFNVTEAISKTGKLFERFGGHAQAAGFTVRAENLEKAKIALTQIADEQINDADLVALLKIEMAMKLSDLSLDLIQSINRFKPFGFGNSTPVFAFNDCRIDEIRPIGRDLKHIKLKVSQFAQEYVDVIAFNKAEDFAQVRAGDIIDIAATIDQNTWNDKTTVQLLLKDFILK